MTTTAPWRPLEVFFFFLSVQVVDLEFIASPPAGVVVEPGWDRSVINGLGVGAGFTHMNSDDRG